MPILLKLPIIHLCHLKILVKKRHLIDILILNNSTRFDNILRNVVTEVFNPATLFPHIDELKEFIHPFVELDKIPDVDDKYPGRLNENAEDYTIEQWDANCEFTKIKSNNSFAYGLKQWILEKYRYVCKAYKMDCDETYLDENYEYTVDKEVEYVDNGFGGFGGFGKFGGFGAKDINGEEPTEVETDEAETEETETE